MDSMDPWQRNIRMMHHINEFLDLDSAKSNLVDEFIALFNAIREGLTHIDDDFHIPDSQINVLFLSKLKSRPEWDEWAAAMMRDPRVNASDPPTERMSFDELAGLAREQEHRIRVQEEELPDSGISLPVQPAPPADDAGAADEAAAQPPSQAGESEIDPMGWGGAALRIQTRPRAVTQHDINAFVVRKMNQEELYRSRSARGHARRLNQDEINQYVVEQMRREQDRKTRVRSHSQPEPRMQDHQQQQQQSLLPQRGKSTRTPRCRFCGDLHPTDRCWRRWRVAVEAPQANFAPKRVEFRTEVPGQPPMYRTGFTLY